MPRILILAARDDRHSEAVCWGLRQLGHAPVAWYWSDFPRHDMATLRLGGGREAAPELKIGGACHDQPFDVVWLRRRESVLPMEHTHDDDRAAVLAESAFFASMLFLTLGHEGTRWVNHPDANSRCDNRALQAAVAERCGFRVPHTLMSNDPGAVRAFFAERGGAVVNKGFTHLYWDNGDGSRTVNRTSLLTAAHVARDFPLRACPGIYQEKIEKRHELRVTVMGDIVLAAKIDSQCEGPTIDWRLDGGRGLTNLRRTEIDAGLAARCVALCRALDLAFGCIDLIVTPDGEIVFLEVNQGGQFLFKEGADPDFPVLDIFCRFLAGEPAAASGSHRLRLAEFERLRKAGTACAAAVAT